jgi:hypothetical protein
MGRDIILYTVIFLTVSMLLMPHVKTLQSLTTTQIVLTYIGAYAIGLLLLWVISWRSPRT